ncbi:accumulation of dyads protein 2 [Physcomitrium patens]|nr:accumulation of dyads protein 2-like [Physcomitrium patens]XP_024386505.1 accumulation of dyads protein 2-like [Physcomitrium patens]XP_024386506.1 accumulation of dyads protein 2-like [Physcomitrium patens]|eukprot:XP_024386504.1 accumulation of dyads protein 2-like [Physcomitrella patens]
MAENGHYDHDVSHIPPPLHMDRVANPAPLGLFAIALTTFVLSCHNAALFGTSVATPPNVATGLAFFYGGLVLLLAGMWEFKAGNTFGATAFSSYAAFWLSYATILIPGFGFQEAFVGGYEKDALNTVAIFLLAWTLYTFIMWLGTLKANIALSALFAFLTLTLALLTISDFMHAHAGLKKAGGFFGVITSLIAWYMGLAGLLTHENSYFTLPVGNLSKH